MIEADRQACDLAAQALRDFASGRITNNEFEAAEPQTKDPAIRAIWETVWLFYDDVSEHRLTGRHKLPRDLRRGWVRWILFLHSDLPYEWPDLPHPGVDPEPRITTSLLGRLFAPLGGLRESWVTPFLSAGHFPVWPFLSVKDYKRALAAPRLLSGRRGKGRGRA